MVSRPRGLPRPPAWAAFSGPTVTLAGEAVGDRLDQVRQHRRGRPALHRTLREAHDVRGGPDQKLGLGIVRAEADALQGRPPS